MNKKCKIIISALFSAIFLLAFAPPLNPPAGGWTQQFMLNIGGRSITDVFFLDSLTGWAVTNATNQANDTTLILKTTNSGDNWVIQYRRLQTGGGYPGLYRVYFLNHNTGYICGVTGLDKSIDGGTSWTSLNAPLNNYLDMSILNESILWLTSTNPLTGGVYLSLNGGVNWENKFSGGTQNPDKIYMYNARIGFISNSSALPNIYKTTNGGTNWTVNVSGERFFDISFVDSVTGWRTKGDTMKYTSNGGLSWSVQLMPHGGMIFSSNLLRFSVLNRDTIWGCGGYMSFPGNQVKSILWRTINSGINW